MYPFSLSAFVLDIGKKITLQTKTIKEILYLNFILPPNLPYMLYSNIKKQTIQENIKNPRFFFTNILQIHFKVVTKTFCI